MRLIDVIDRLKDRTVCPSLVLVEPAYSLNAVQDQVSQLPAVFVHPVTEQAGTNQVDMCREQRIDIRFGMLIAARNIDLDTRVDELALVRDEIFAALLGHQPIEWVSDIGFVSGDLVDIDQSTIWWRDIYRTNVMRRGVA